MKLVKNMTPEERESALREIKRAARTFEPMPTDKLAKNMSEDERRAFLDECKRRAG